MLDRVRWGLVPSWAKDLDRRPADQRPCRGGSPKPAYRKRVREAPLPDPGRRLLRVAALPARRKKKQKQPYFIAPADREPMAFAGSVRDLARRSDPDAERVRSCAIVTTDANEKLAPIHDRMPVVLPESAWDEWLDPDNHDTARSRVCSCPRRATTSSAIRCRSSSTSPTTTDPSCSTPWTSPSPRSISTREWLERPNRADRARRLIEAYDAARCSTRSRIVEPGFDTAAAYDVLHLIERDRLSAVGFRSDARSDSPTARSGSSTACRARCGHAYGIAPLHRAGSRAASVSLEPFVQPRIEPEVVFGLAAPIPAGDDAVELLSCVEWMAAGFEIVQCHFPGWRFAAPDSTASFGLHGALVVGAPVAVTAENRASVADRLGVVRSHAVAEERSSTAAMGTMFSAAPRLHSAFSPGPLRPNRSSRHRPPAR